MFLFTTSHGYKILVDCGLNYEQGVELEENARFHFNPEEIDLVVLSHAHLDHSGNLPTLVNAGYEGQILCTEPTAALADILLSDSANIQGLHQKIRAKRKKRRGSDSKSGKRLYGHKQVLDTSERFITWPFNKPFEIHDELTITLKPAGHILGAASVVISYQENGESRKIGFTGDLGSKDSKIVVDPEPMEDLDYLVTESTYGGRFRRDERPGTEILKEYVLKSCVEQPGRLIIPAFSVGRTQAVLFTLHQLFESGEIPRGIRVFADSKMGMFSTGIHNRFSDYLNAESKEFLKQHDSMFRFPELYFIEDDADRKVLEEHFEPYIIVSSAGMLEGGRIREHLTNNIQNPACTFLIAGFCSPGTLGDQLLQGNHHIRVSGKDRTVYAKIESTDAFSAHPDHGSLMDYLGNVINNSKLREAFLVHGEPFSIEQISKELEGKIPVLNSPAYGEKFILG